MDLAVLFFPRPSFRDFCSHCILPITSNDWDIVCFLLAENFPPRTPEDLRRMFNSLVRLKPNTVDLHCPWQIRAAKTLLNSIRTKTELETESCIENIDSSGTEDDDLLIEPMESPILEIPKVVKIDNPEIIVVGKTTTGTVAHTTGKKKRKFLPKVSNAINFDDMPLGSPPKLGRKLIHGPNVSNN